MRFPHFWHFGRPARPSDPDDWYASSRAWRDSGLADEVEAFLAGRLVNHLTASLQPMPAWAVLNRLAHADHSDLLRLVEGAADCMAPPSSGQADWVAAERFVAAHLLARARTPDDLGRLQRAALVPLELVLIELTKIDPLTADEVLQLGAEAVDSYYPAGELDPASRAASRRSRSSPQEAQIARWPHRPRRPARAQTRELPRAFHGRDW